MLTQHAAPLPRLAEKSESRPDASLRAAARSRRFSRWKTGRVYIGRMTTPNEEFITTSSGLRYRDVSPGEGTEAQAGVHVSVHYVGTLEDGSTFDSSRERGSPFSFDLGNGQVIAGWDEGVAGMRVGGVRLLHIPPDLGYGARGYPPVIPANAWLNFEVELMDIG